MRISFALVALAILLPACELVTDRPQTTRLVMAPALEASVPDTVKALYRVDAARLALRHLAASQDPAKLPVEIPERDVEAMFNGLLHVYNSASAARDTVAALHFIRTFPRPALFQIIVSFDHTLPWTQAWRDGERLTGNESIDHLLNKYDLQLKRYYDWGFGHAVVLTSPQPVNLVALSRLFAAIDGIRYAEPNSYGGDGSDITAEWLGSRLLLEYSLAWGDCPAGCIERRYWTFSVSRTGDVAFVGSRGPALPDRFQPGW